MSQQEPNKEISNADKLPSPIEPHHSQITDINNFTALLYESEKRYRRLFELSPVAVYVIDADGRIAQFNRHAAELWGKVPTIGDTDQRFCGSHKMFLPDGSYLPHHLCPMATVVGGQLVEARDQEVVIERPDGSRVTVIVNIVPIKTESGEITGAINCFYDITERSRLERETQAQAKVIAEQEQRKDEFLAMLSHELRNPLASILHATQLLGLQKDENPQQRKARNVIERQIGQLTHLIDDLMEISRINAGKIHLVQKQTSMTSIVEQAFETTRPLVSKHRHELTASLPQDPIWLHADPVRIEQVLVNLITNAAKYSEDGGLIEVTVQQQGEMMELRVRDSGIGIHPELLPRIFDLFTQADRSLDRSQGGLGIGLCLAKRIVEMHDGTISVQSVLGQGSEFVVAIPAVLRTSLPSPSSGIGTEGLPGKRCQILVVDDNVDAAQTLGALLEAALHDVRVVHNGTDALVSAMVDRPDAILLDIGLAGLDGYETAKAIREQPSLKDIVLIAITGYGSETDRTRSREAGFNHHLVKPTNIIDVQKILATI